MTPAIQMGSVLAAFGERIEAVLDSLLPASGSAERLYQAMRYALFGGGKYLRPYIVDASAGIFEVSQVASLRTGAAVEMIHAYSLVHDDLPAMDDDDLRRGRATCHRAFDEATAILAGDALLTLAFQTWRRLKPTPTLACAQIWWPRSADSCGRNGNGGRPDD